MKRFLPLIMLLCLLPALAQASWFLNTWVKSGGGSIAVDNGTPQTVLNSSVFTSYTGAGPHSITVTSQTGYSIKTFNISSEVSCTGDTITKTCTTQGATDQYVQATFVPGLLSVTAAAGNGGSVNLQKISNVYYGSKLYTARIFSFTPVKGYNVTSININGIPAGSYGNGVTVSSALPAANNSSVKVTLPDGFVFTSNIAISGAFSGPAVAITMPPQVVPVNTTAILNGSPSTGAISANGSVIPINTYTWKQIGGPGFPGTKVIADNSSGVTQSFVPTVAGNYIFSLTVDGGSTAYCYVTASADSATAVKNTCQNCHTANGIGTTQKVYSNWSSSQHRQSFVSCVACHVDSATSHPGSTVSLNVCSTCHADMAQHTTITERGQACATCHDPHNPAITFANLSSAPILTSVSSHPQVILYTYEELAQQFGVTKLPVTDNTPFPYSPKQTCGTSGCHNFNGADYDYKKITETSFHSHQGRSEYVDSADGKLNPQLDKPWIQSTGMVGKMCAPSLYQTANFMKQNNSINALDYMQSVSPNHSNAFMKGDSVTAVANGSLSASVTYTMVDLSAWELATRCGSCHPGGSFTEIDRNGTRYSQLSQSNMTPYNTTVFEQYSSHSGLPKHTVMTSPWAYPLTINGTAVITPNGFGQGGQVMMPNVKEFDCLACHLKGYSNLMSSVMAYSGAFNAEPSFGAGLMNMFTQKYDFSTGELTKDATTNAYVLAAPIQQQPASQNCKNCHMPTPMVGLPDMMRDFLSSAPMAYTGSTQSFTGLSMPSYDFNAPFGYTWDWQVGAYATSPVLYMDQNYKINSNPASNVMIPAGWPAAMGPTLYNSASNTQGFLGGGNPAQTGPIYYEAPNGNGTQDQNALKKGWVPFPRAEWFKRGDLWADGYDVHINLECAGCHMQTATAKVDTFTNSTSVSFNGKSLCDPGRGFDWISGIESNPLYRTKVNSQNTVKRCENCHITGKNNDGVAIETYGAPNPTAMHESYGLMRNITNAVFANGTTGTQAVANAAALGGTNVGTGGSYMLKKGNHLDVVECAVCHLYRNQMVVRLLDASSGDRYPNMLGFDTTKGMLGMFSDPMNQGNAAGSNYKPWNFGYQWQKDGNDFKTQVDGSGTITGPNPNWRRKIYPVNYISASMWNNVDPTVDANGDGVFGAPPSRHPANYVNHEPDYAFGSYTTSSNFDPWIARDLKAGINFASSGFAPIPVGFGTGQYKNAYVTDANGTPQYSNESWNFIGVYGGNTLFSTPDEISSYKAYRESIKDSVDGKSWKGTQLTFIGVPFALSHGARQTSTYVVGKSCTDCHDSSSSALIPLFSGSIDMLGTAIKATAGANLFQSPATQFTVLGNTGDIATGVEGTSKLGYSFEIPFQVTCASADSKTGMCLGGTGSDGYTSGTVTNPGTALTQVVPLDRGTVLYPFAGTDRHYTYTDVNGNAYADRNAWINYLTNPTAIQNAAHAADGH